jgi:hypothetical protein
MDTKIITKKLLAIFKGKTKLDFHNIETTAEISSVKVDDERNYSLEINSKKGFSKTTPNLKNIFDFYKIGDTLGDKKFELNFTADEVNDKFLSKIESIMRNIAIVNKTKTTDVELYKNLRRASVDRVVSRYISE